MRDFKIIGQTAVTNKYGRVQSFLYDASNPTGPLRSIKDHQNDAIKAVEEGTTVIHIHIVILFM